MVIRNKDGSIYRLKGPNPLLKDQSQWDDFTVHNFRFEPETKNNVTPPVKPIQTDFKIKSTIIEEEKKEILEI